MHSQTTQQFSPGTVIHERPRLGTNAKVQCRRANYILIVNPETPPLPLLTIYGKCWHSRHFSRANMTGFQIVCLSVSLYTVGVCLTLSYISVWLMIHFLKYTTFEQVYQTPILLSCCPWSLLYVYLINVHCDCLSALHNQNTKPPCNCDEGLGLIVYHPFISKFSKLENNLEVQIWKFEMKVFKISKILSTFSMIRLLLPTQSELLHILFTSLSWSVFGLL